MSTIMPHRDQIRIEINSITPLDDHEASTKSAVLAWIDSGVVLCRIEKPATPNKHLVSYCVVVDGDHILLVDHINAQLWLPTGGHVDPEEHPRATALREVEEELGIKGAFLREGPVLLTSTVTVGKTAGHTDVSLWYAIKGDKEGALSFDHSEFKSVRWFHREEVPLERSDPQLGRFIAKLYGDSDASL